MSEPCNDPLCPIGEPHSTFNASCASAPLKKGSILEWRCTFRLSDGEIAPLLDALIKNASLTFLDLSEAGMEWAGPDAAKARSGSALIEAMVASETVASLAQAAGAEPKWASAS